MRKFKITVNGEIYSVTVEEIVSRGEAVTEPKNIAMPQEIITPAVSAPEPQPSAVKLDIQVGDTPVKAPIPGVVLEYKVAAGDKVEENQIILILEAMKMENEVMAPCSGVVKAIPIAKGSKVNAGDVMMIIG